MAHGTGIFMESEKDERRIKWSSALFSFGPFLNVGCCDLFISRKACVPFVQYPFLDANRVLFDIMCRFHFKISVPFGRRLTSFFLVFLSLPVFAGRGRRL